MVDGYGARIAVERGHLVIEQGSFGEGKTTPTRISRGRSTFSRLIVRSPAGMISLDALDWCNRMGTPIAILGSDSRLINCLVPDQSHDGPVKRAQAITAMTDDALRLGRWILTRKLQSQAGALGQDIRRLGFPSEREGEVRQAIGEIQSALDAVQFETTLDGLLMREGYAARCYWSVLTGLPLPWPTWAAHRVPNHWLSVNPRFSGGRNQVRDARDPFNAILNYCYTLLEVEARVACEVCGLDPDLGILHVDDRLRESFVYDLMEPARAVVDVLALEFVNRIGLRPYMFHELRDGIVRLDPDLAKELTQMLMTRMRKPIMAEATSFAAELRRIKVPYRLSRFTRDAGPRYRKGRIPPSRPGFCEYCKKPVPKPGLKFCNRDCYLRHSVEVRQPIKLAQARLAELRAQGLSPGHGGQAARKRGLKIALSNRRRASE